MPLSSLRRILYVEDEQSSRAIVKLILEQLGGFDVSTCASGQEALNIIPEYNPNMILLDVMLPDMDGPSIFKQLRQLPEFKNTPVVFLTADDQINKDAYIKSGILDVISKSFDTMQLPKIIEKLWVTRECTN